MPCALALLFFSQKCEKKTEKKRRKNEHDLGRGRRRGTGALDDVALDLLLFFLLLLLLVGGRGGYAAAESAIVGLELLLVGVLAVGVEQVRRAGARGGERGVERVRERLVVLGVVGGRGIHRRKG